MSNFYFFTLLGSIRLPVAISSSFPHDFLHTFHLALLANFVIVAGAYGYAFVLDADDEGDDSSESNQPAWLKFVYKSLDFGSGRERGARK